MLVSRTEIITPEMEQAARTLLSKLGDRSAGVREEAIRGLQERGRFAEATLKYLAEKTTDPQIRALIAELISTGGKADR